MFKKLKFNHFKKLKISKFQFYQKIQFFYSKRAKPRGWQFVKPGFTSFIPRTFRPCPCRGGRRSRWCAPPLGTPWLLVGLPPPGGWCKCRHLTSSDRSSSWCFGSRNRPPIEHKWTEKYQCIDSFEKNVIGQSLLIGWLDRRQNKPVCPDIR